MPTRSAVLSSIPPATFNRAFEGPTVSSPTDGDQSPNRLFEYSEQRNAWQLREDALSDAGVSPLGVDSSPIIIFINSPSEVVFDFEYLLPFLWQFSRRCKVCRVDRHSPNPAALGSLWSCIKQAIYATFQLSPSPA